MSHTSSSGGENSTALAEADWVKAQAPASSCVPECAPCAGRAEEAPSKHQQPTENSRAFHQLAGSSSSVQLERDCFPSHRETDNAGAVASLSIPLTCRRKIPSLPKHSKTDSPDVGKALTIERIKPVSVTSCLYGFTSEIAPGLNSAKELKSHLINSTDEKPTTFCCSYIFPLALQKLLITHGNISCWEMWLQHPG